MKTKQPIELVAPSKWVCPECGTKLQTYIPTYVPECRAPKHSRRTVLMVVTK